MSYCKSLVEPKGEAARELDRLRTGWFNPPEWTREEVLEFPGSASGPWARYVHDPDSRGIGTVAELLSEPQTTPFADSGRATNSLGVQRPDE